MQALILAAGRGSRLGKITDATPKCLLTIGTQPIVAHQLESLSEAGLAPVALVVGYCADEIRALVGIRAEYLDNLKWNTTNSLYSFSLAREWIKGPVVILNSDVIFHPLILHRLLAAGGDAIVYDSSSEDAPEHMKVRVLDGQLVDMSKDIPGTLSSGENVGMLCFTAETVQRLLDKAQVLLASGGEQSWLSAGVRELGRECRIRAVDIAGLPWTEIDSAQDLETARLRVWPAIQKRHPRGRRCRLMTTLAALLLSLGAISVLAMRPTPSPRTESWELIELPTESMISLQAGDQKRTWWIIAKDSILAENLCGPRKVRVDSRLLQKEDTQEAVPYLLSIELDEKLVDWFKKNGKPSGTWKHPDWAVGRLRSFDVELPPGPHTLRIGFMSTIQGPACAIRLRQLEPDDPD
ncbi:MAG: phosphocholine cytidylyltransferase family protein [Planctomycetes bacterium]|nr:phosphocholine cytidylyltransferase family protein [Planctomycetota bacterium]